MRKIIASCAAALVLAACSQSTNNDSPLTNPEAKDVQHVEPKKASKKKILRKRKKAVNTQEQAVAPAQTEEKAEKAQ